MATRRDFLRIVGVIGASVALMPSVAAQRIAPPDMQDDTALVNATLGRGESLRGGTYRMSEPLRLRSGARVDGVTFQFTRTLPHIFEVPTGQRNIVVQNSRFIFHVPSFAERVLRRFA